MIVLMPRTLECDALSWKLSELAAAKSNENGYD